jgi:O-antigen/teichoic acid export membrane protein
MTAASILPARLDVRRAYLGNLVASSGEAATRFVLGLALARLLAPAELGLFALASAVLGIVQMLRDFGVSAYLQREPRLTPERFCACLGLQVFTTAMATLALVLLAEPLAHLLGQPGLAPLVRVLALGVPLTAFSSVMAALQLRELAAMRIARVSWLGIFSQALVALPLSVQGAGAVGLAWAQNASILACALAYAFMRPAGLQWRPSRRGWGEVLSFGSGSLLASGLASLHGALPDLLLGRLGAAHQVGLLGRAQATVGLLQAAAGPALNFGALPLLADRHARAQALEPTLRRATALLTGLCWPVLALTVLWREPLVRLLYGPAWLACTEAVLPLALLAALGMAFAQQGQAVAAVGRPGLAALPTAVSLLARLALGAAFFDGSLASFAWALCAASVVALPLQLALSARVLGQPPSAWLAALGGSAGATLAVGAAGLLLPWPLLPLVWLVALKACRHPLADELAQLARRFMTSRK